MKYILVRLIAVFMCFSSASLAQGKAVKTINNGWLLIPMATALPVIDGQQDDIWTNVTAIPLVLNEGGPADTVFNFSDHAAWARFMWDGDNFYAFVTVVDDSLYNTDVITPWSNDAIEIYFDGGNEKAASYDANDIEWRWVRGETVESHPISGTVPGNWVWGEFPGGYTFELAIPQAQLQKNGNQLFPLWTDCEIGLEISNTDRDSEFDSRKSVLHWWTTNSLTSQRPNTFGTAVLGFPINKSYTTPPALEIPFSYSIFTVDGLMSEDESWYMVNEVSMLKYEGNVNEYPDPHAQTNWKDHEASFWMIHNNRDKLYLFVNVIDDSLYNTDVNSPEMNDCIEMFLDRGNERGLSYDANDVHWCWVRNETVANHPISGDVPGNWIWKDTPLGYSFELELPLDSFPSFYEEFGFEISNADRDSEGGGRKNVLHWWSYNSDVRHNPSSFGTAIMATWIDGLPEIGAENNRSDGVTAYTLGQNYPNPFNPTTHIMYSIPKKESVQLTVSDVLGHRVAVLVNETKDAGYYTEIFNAQNLASGIYFYRLEAGSKIFTKKMIVIK